MHSKEFNGELNLISNQKVIFGRGSLQQLPKEVKKLGAKRAFLVTTPSINSKTDLAHKIEGSLGKLWVGSFAESRQHTPSRVVSKATAKAREARADLLVSLGGGSVIDTAKLIALALSKETERAIPHVTISTTLSAAEYTDAAEMTDERKKRKRLRRDARMTPRVVVLDPEVTLPTPGWLWASTGVKALDHAMERIYSTGSLPLTDALAANAISLLMRFLPRSLEESEDLSARTQCQMGAWASVFGGFGNGAGLSHALGQHLGARWNIPNGVTSCLTQPYVMRFLAPATLDRQSLIAEAMEINIRRMSPKRAAEAAATSVERLIERLEQRRRLREFGLRNSDLKDLIDALPEEVIQTCPRSISSREELYDMIKLAW